MRISLFKREQFASRCRSRGTTIERAAGCILREADGILTVDADHPDYPAGPAIGVPGGPGSELKKLFSALGFAAKQGCGCADFATKMDRWGPDGCEQRIDEILAHLRIQAAKASIPFSAFVAEKLVRLAIRRARKSAQKPPPGGHKPNSP